MLEKGFLRNFVWILAVLVFSSNAPAAEGRSPEGPSARGGLFAD